MLSKKIKDLKNNIPQHTLNNINQYIIKIDYFDHTDTKNFEDNIPLRYILNSNVNLSKTNIEHNYT